MSHVFISYKHGDFEASNFLEILEKRSDSAKITIWRDTGIQAGDNWEREIDTAIDDCFALLLLLSENVSESQYVTYEWTRALTLGKPVIPLLISKQSILHPRLEKTQFLNFTEDNHQSWLELMARLNILSNEYHVKEQLRQEQHLNETRQMFTILETLYDSRITTVTAEDIITTLSFEQFLSAKDYAKLIDMSRKNQWDNQ